MGEQGNEKVVKMVRVSFIHRDCAEMNPLLLSDLPSLHFFHSISVCQSTTESSDQNWNLIENKIISKFILSISKEKEKQTKKKETAYSQQLCFPQLINNLSNPHSHHNPIAEYR